MITNICLKSHYDRLHITRLFSKSDNNKNKLHSDYGLYRDKKKLHNLKSERLTKFNILSKTAVEAEV